MHTLPYLTPARPLIFTIDMDFPTVGTSVHEGKFLEDRKSPASLPTCLPTYLPETDNEIYPLQGSFA